MDSERETKVNKPKRLSTPGQWAGVIALSIAMTWIVVSTANATAAPRAAAGLPDGTFTLVCTVEGGVVTECRPPAVTPSPTATATPTPSPAPSSTTSTPSSTPTPTPTTSTPPPAYPTAATTGVPPFVALSAYTGPCTITTANTIIEAKIVGCSPLRIRAANVIVRNSQTKAIENGSANQPAWTFQVINSDVIANTNETAVGESNYRLIGSDVRGGNRGANCFQNCWIEGNYIHGNRISGSTHSSGVRMGMDTTIWGNTITCDVTNTGSGGGCSADLTGYPDFSPVRNNLITKNRFLPTQGYYCAYGGWEPGKDFNGDPTNATHIRFIDNLFERGPSGRCGAPSDGWAITSYQPNRTGNLWSANRWSDGTPVAAVKP